MKLGTIIFTAVFVGCTTPQPSTQNIATVVRVRAIVGNAKEKTVLLGLTRDAHKWGTPGGALEAGEDPKSAVLREVFEETGLGSSAITGIKLLQHDAARKTAVFGICINHATPPLLTTAGDKDKEFSELAWFKLGAFAANTYSDAIERANLFFAENDRSHFCGIPHQDLSQHSNGWKIGAKIHFEQESGHDYLGLKELNKLTKDALKSVFYLKTDSSDSNAKILLKKNNGQIQIDHYVEKDRTNIGEAMHATLLYTSPRGFHSSETLTQVCKVLFADCDSPPEVAAVSRRYSAIIKPSWRFKISEVVITKNNQGPAFIMAKLLFDNRENIYLNSHAISAGLHLTLVNCADSSILSDPLVIDKLTKQLNESLREKFVKIAGQNDVPDLEFGISGQPWRIRAGQKIEFKK